MRPHRRIRPFAFVTLVVSAFSALLETRAQSESPAPWLAYADPAEAGFSAAKLEDARVLADNNKSAAVMAIYRGRVIAAWGAVDRPLMAHSVRKSLAGALYGIAAAEGRWSLDATLAELGVDDEPPLTKEEKQARVRDLLAARSGVYHGAAYADGEQERQRPARGRHAPGTFWFYNNWDFNAAEAIYQQKSGEDLYSAFDRKVARPIGMEDFDSSDQLRVLEPSQSRLAAHTFRISARDLARFGQLYLQEGRWGNRQVVPREWVRESFRTHSTAGEKTGYGYLWWIYEPGSLGDSYPTLNRAAVYLARGTGGQAIFVLPSAEMVVVHRGDTENGRSVAGPQVWSIVERLVAAKAGPGSQTPALAPMRVLPLTSNLPAPARLRLFALDEAELRRFAGDYVMPQGGVARVFLHDRRLFMTIPGQGEAELFATDPATFTIKVQSGVVVRFELMPDGAVAGVEVTIGRQKIQAVRR
jgi:CubicO group peptidase (beta-lactamase class C family)